MVMVVDDEENFREIFQAELAAAGYPVVTAENGKVAVEKAKALKPGLILMDVRMPVMDGITAAVEIKRDPLLANTKIVFLTNLSDPTSEVENSLQSQIRGASFGYIKKTENLGMVVDKVKEYISAW